MIDDHRPSMTKDGAQKNSARDPGDASLPVSVLTVLGALIVVLGLFAAGDLTVVVVGLAAIATAGVLHVMGTNR